MFEQRYSLWMFEAEIQNAHMCFRHQTVQFGAGLNAVKVTAVCEIGPVSWSSGWMKTDADKAIQMMTCPTETASLISWPLVSASASSFRSDRTGSLNNASKCLTNRYQQLIVNCCIFEINLVQYKNAPSFHISRNSRSAGTRIELSDWLS